MLRKVRFLVIQCDRNTYPITVNEQQLWLFHFRSESLEIGVEAGSDLAAEPVLDGIARDDPMLMGIGLHAYQDSWSHAGFKPFPGHVIIWVKKVLR